MTKSRSWFRCAATGDNEAEIVIYDEIGLWGITAGDFHNELKALGKDVSTIVLRINSPGGSVFDGIAIYNMLKRHKAYVEAHVDGVAASIASVILMAADKIIMPDNAMLMIHDPSGYVVGRSAEMRKLAAVLDDIKDNIISAYEAKSGMTREELADYMTEDSWFTAEEAVELGLADEVTKSVKVAARFDLSRFKNAPANAGRKPRGKTEPAAHQPSDNKETDTMSDDNKPGNAPAPAAGADTQPAAAATQPAAPTTPAATETPEQMQNRIRTEMQASNKSIRNACALAGFDNKADEYINAGKTLTEVLDALQTLRAGNTSGDPVTPAHKTNAATPGGQAIDATNIWNKWNKRKVTA